MGLQQNNPSGGAAQGLDLNCLLIEMESVRGAVALIRLYLYLFNLNIFFILRVLLVLQMLGPNALLWPLPLIRM